MTQRHKVRKAVGKNGTNRLACHGTATNVLSAGNAAFAKYNKANCRKARLECINYYFNLQSRRNSRNKVQTPGKWDLR